MEILFLGTGSAFCLNNFQSNALLIENNKKLLIDAGGDIRFALHEQNLTYRDVDAVYISHLHNDHIGGLEHLALESYFKKPAHKIKLYTHKSLADTLWNNSLKGGLSVINKGNLILEDYYELTILDKSFNWEGISFNLIETIHSADKPSNHPVFGLMIEPRSGMKIYFTGDTRFVPEIIGNNYAKADIIIQDTETGVVRSGIHAHFDDLVNLDKDIKEKMYLWHYQDNVSDEFEHWQEIALKNNFKGFVEKGRRISV